MRFVCSAFVKRASVFIDAVNDTKDQTTITLLSAMEKDSELFVFTVYIFREEKVQSLFLSFLNDDEVTFSVEKDSELFSFVCCVFHRETTYLRY